MKKHYAISTLLFSMIILMSGTIDLENLYNYSNQNIPAYITKDNTGGNPITDEGATLGRVLFYDKKLSSSNTIACASCHKQEFAFSDISLLSQGVNGVTGRHSMRLINARFSNEENFFWDERADSLEMQTTMPIQDHLEMGYSGMNGDPSFADLLTELDALSYYDTLFYLAFGDTLITEDRIQKALAQFVRSIQSFDSRYDEGVALNGGNLGGPFPNFTMQENMGKMLFAAPPAFEMPPPGQPPSGNRIGGGLGCQICHAAPEFDIRPNSGNNGVIAVANNPAMTDLTVTRSPSLRDLFSPSGATNGPMMHDASMPDFEAVLDHYNDIDFDPQVNPELDIRLTGVAVPPGPPGMQPPPGPGQNLLMTQEERDAITAFMLTLTGEDVYTDARWSDPFEPDGSITLQGNVCNMNVTNINFYGLGSLESAIACAVDGDTIILGNAIADQSIDMNGGIINLSKNITINAIGNNITLFTGDNSVFDIANGGGVTLIGFDIENNSVLFPTLNNSGVLEIENMVIANKNSSGGHVNNQSSSNLTVKGDCEIR